MNIHAQRKSPRLSGYDYSQNGAYFVTICTNNHECLFGEIIDSELVLNEYGKIVEQEIYRTMALRQNIQICHYVIMPNHIHAIMMIDTVNHPTADNCEQFGKPVSSSISTIVRSIKSAVTKQIRSTHEHDTHGHGTPCPYKIWQSRFHDHIIRNQDEYTRIYEYITNNSVQWESDCLNRKNIPLAFCRDTACRVRPHDGGGHLPAQPPPNLKSTP